MTLSQYCMSRVYRQLLDKPKPTAKDRELLKVLERAVRRMER